MWHNYYYGLLPHTKLLCTVNSEWNYINCLSYSPQETEETPEKLGIVYRTRDLPSAEEWAGNSCTDRLRPWMDASS